MRLVDQDTRLYVQDARIQKLESDYYDSPNRLAEDSDGDDEQFEELLQDNDSKIKKKPKKKRINKRTRRESTLRRNLNLQKMIKEEAMEEQTLPNFVNIRAEYNKFPQRKFCSVCGMMSKYTCLRCGERYCTLKCYRKHRDIFCSNYQYDY